MSVWLQERLGWLYSLVQCFPRFQSGASGNRMRGLGIPCRPCHAKVAATLAAPAVRTALRGSLAPTERWPRALVLKNPEAGPAIRPGYPPPEDTECHSRVDSPLGPYTSHPSLSLPTSILPGHHHWWLPRSSTQPAGHPLRSSEPGTHVPDPKGKSGLCAGRRPQGGAPAVGWQVQQAQPAGPGGEIRERASKLGQCAILSLIPSTAVPGSQHPPGPSSLTCSVCEGHQG